MTDAVSANYSFPHWHRYYGTLFGPKNLFVMTYVQQAGLFAEFDLGGVIELPVKFAEQLRADAVGRFVTLLLACYDVVIRVDTDEFLVVDPTVAPTLADFIETMSEPYLTARGFDVVQLPGEPTLVAREGSRLLRDRAYAYPNTALNKTCITAVPLQWSTGFHWATVFPVLGAVFMLHMKRIDVGWQIAHLQEMTASLDPAEDASMREYHSADEAKIVEYHAGVVGRPRLPGLAAWYRSRLIAAFLTEIRLDRHSGLYSGQYGHEEVLCEIPRDWKRIL